MGGFFAGIVMVVLYRHEACGASECGTVVGGVLLIIGVAAGFTNYLVDAQPPACSSHGPTRTSTSSTYSCCSLNLLLLLKGAFMDVFSAIIVMVPLITPLAAGFGIEPVQLGIISLRISNWDI